MNAFSLIARVIELGLRALAVLLALTIFALTICSIAILPPLFNIPIAFLLDTMVEHSGARVVAQFLDSFRWVYYSKEREIEEAIITVSSAVVLIALAISAVRFFMF